MKHALYAILALSLSGITSIWANDDGDGKTPVSKSNILNLFHRIQKVESRAAVEEIVGKPVFPALVQKDGSSSSWYVSEQEASLRSVDSPWGPAGIVVHYDVGGRVVSSKYNAQWVKEAHLRRYLRKFKPARAGIDAVLSPRSCCQHNTTVSKAMNCPNDHEPLETTTYEAGVEVDICPKCQGVWLGEAELEKIQETKENDYSEQLSQIPDPIIQAYQLAGAKTEAERMCPKCGKALDKEEYAHCSGITIDVCTSCAGIWLDRGELEALEVFFERAQQEVAEDEAAEEKATEKSALKRAFLQSLRFVFRKA